jgi:hypothetical protein
MKEPVFIDKNKTLLPAQDYYFLREKGLEYIQSLSGRLWTDHNLHDPGITILEILCYALTDLGYRTGFDIKDLLAAPDGRSDLPRESGLFPAHEVLTHQPTTVFDYRKLLVKIKGVRNAWLDPMTDPGLADRQREAEVAVYVDDEAGALSYAPLNARGRENRRLHLNGLYRVIVELEIDETLGSLNESRLIYQVKHGKLKGATISIDSREKAFLDGAIDFSGDFKSVLEVVSVAAQGDGYIGSVRLDTSGGEIVLHKLALRLLDFGPQAGEAGLPVTEAAWRDLLADSGQDAPLLLFWQKQQRRKQILGTVFRSLNAHRNLCEDFLSIRTVEPEHLAVCAEIDVRSEADLEAVQARVFHAIEKYLNPPIRFYSLRELLEEGLGPEEIFNTPYIDPAFPVKAGFIKTGDLENSELRRSVYVSDLINAVMDFQEVVAVRNVLLQKYDTSGDPVGGGEKWRLDITPNRQPVLSLERSRLLFYKNQIPYRAKTAEFLKTLEHYRAMDRKAAYVEPGQVLDLPQGRYRHPGQFFSLQHDFPKTYGIGRAGLPANADQARLAQARQLKAYLTFFDQVLADYLAQLAEVRRLFSLDKNLGRTYFSPYLEKIAGVREAFETEFYAAEAEGKILLRDEARRHRLTEDEVLYQDRRNRVLDHLLARFAEQFTDYVLMMFSLEGDPLKTGEELIHDKIDFLREYPVLSRERQKAGNHSPESPVEVWEAHNVSGLEKRLKRLVGIRDAGSRNLACKKARDVLFSTRKVNEGFRLEIKDAKNVIVFKSLDLFPERLQAMAAAEDLFPAIRRESSYRIDASGGPGQVFFTVNAEELSLRHDALYNTEAEARQNIRAIMRRYDEILHTHPDCNQEGFHLIEHILLRPLDKEDPLLSVCLDPEGGSGGLEDPYSFLITVVLPYWPKRFRSLDFRRHFELTLRQETPAHILARICWVDNDRMAELEAKYRAWLESRARRPRARPELSAALADLITVLQQLQTVYPAATLHDCMEDAKENPLRLGATNLGIF